MSHPPDLPAFLREKLDPDVELSPLTDAELEEIELLAALADGSLSLDDADEETLGRALDRLGIETVVNIVAGDAEQGNPEYRIVRRSDGVPPSTAMTREPDSKPDRPILRLPVVGAILATAAMLLLLARLIVWPDSRTPIIAFQWPQDDLSARSTLVAESNAVTARQSRTFGFSENRLGRAKTARVGSRSWSAIQRRPQPRPYSSGVLLEGGDIATAGSGGGALGVGLRRFAERLQPWTSAVWTMSPRDPRRWSRTTRWRGSHCCARHHSSRERESPSPPTPRIRTSCS